MKERIYSADEAIVEAKDYLAKFLPMGVVTRVQNYEVGEDYPIYSVFIMKDGKIITEGHGKGIGQASLASAYCESVEHFSDEPIFFLDKDCGFEANKMIKFLSYEDFFQQEEIKTFMYMNSVKNLKELGFKGKIPCVLTKSLISGSEFFLPFPIISINYPFPNTSKDVNPKFFYDESCYNFSEDLLGKYNDLYPVMKYSTTTGCASGLDYSEAVLHGILEVIERDAMSLFLLNQFHNNRNDTCQISPDMLSDSNKKIYEHLSDEYGDILLLDVTTDITVPAITAYLLETSTSVPISGQGCSLSFDYAVERALLELKQSIIVTPKEMVEKIQNHQIQMAKSENILFYQKSASYNPLRFSNNPKVDTEIINAYKNVPDMNVQDSLSYVIELLRKKNFDVFVFDRCINSKISCVKVIIPGMEDLSLGGHLLLPSERGLSILEEK